MRRLGECCHQIPPSPETYLCSGTQRTALLHIAKAYRTTSNISLQVMCKRPPIDKVIKLYYDIWNIKWGKNINTSIGVIQADVLKRPIDISNAPYPNDITNFSHTFLSEPSISIYTDGSRAGNQVGCSFIVYQNDTEIFQRRARLFGGCSVLQSELLAIKLAIDWCFTNYHNVNIALYSDSNSAISLLGRRNMYPIARKIQEDLKKSDNSICINWVRAHQGNISNERADALAKSAATDDTLPIEYNKLNLQTIKKLLWNDLLASWQQDWDLAQNITYQFFPDISAIYSYKWITPNFQLTQFLSNHGRFNAYLRRFVNPQNSGICPDCNTQNGSLHYILDCAMLEPERALLCILVNHKQGHWPQDHYGFLNDLINDKETYDQFILLINHYNKRTNVSTRNSPSN
ncbi:uncharacterized protein [Centruroides vittatus]|uniref:uncharacterized protein n=1 Tax=Centruroides vittatus TaxID=120091 RepID=UPI0035106C12